MGNTGMTERRGFYRLEDSCYLEYRLCTEDEVRSFERGNYPQAGRVDDSQQELDFISRQITPLLAGIREAQPEVAQFLEGLNRKVDLISDQLYFEQFRAHPEQGLISTRTTNISEYGMGFVSDQPLQSGQYIFCRLVIVNFRAGIETFAEVMHCHKTDEGRYAIGLKLPWVLESDRKQLVRYIMSCQREYRRKLAAHAGQSESEPV